MPRAGLAERSYELAVRSLDLQERTLEQLRSRAGSLLAASLLTGSFLGSQAIQRSGGLGPPGLLALLATAASMSTCVYVLAPKRGFAFSFSGPRIYEELLPFAEDDDEIHRRLAYWLERYWERNQLKVDRLGQCFVAATLTLLLQLALWSWALLDTLV